MRKLLLVLFLCSLASTAFAKVEIWKCDFDENGKYDSDPNASYTIDDMFDTDQIIKIDTKKPTIEFRITGKWFSFSDLKREIENDMVFNNYKYNDKDMNISIDVTSNSQNKTGNILIDLLTQTLFFIEHKAQDVLKISCIDF